jgi:hypothetical protein
MRNAALLLVTVFASMATVADAQMVCLDGRCEVRRPVQSLVARAVRPAPAVVVVDARPVEHVVETAPQVVIHEHRHVSPSHVCDAPAPQVVVESHNAAQEWANHVAATGSYKIVRRRMVGGHCPHKPQGLAEGIGCSSESPEDAVQRCCYWGERTPVEIGTAWCPSKRQWVAVVRYH